MTRATRVRKILKAENLDALFISSSYNIFYLTGFDGFQIGEREGYALITISSLYLFASPLTAEGARNKTQDVKVIELTPKKRLIQSLKEIFVKEKIQTVGFEENLTFSEHKQIRKAGGKWKLVEEIVESVRVIKNPIELGVIKKACNLTDQTYFHVLKNTRLNITELDLAWEIERYIREHGGELAFPSIVAFGTNSAIPHHKTSNRKLESNNIILLDFGAKVNGYCSDMTRTIYFGKAPEKFKKMYETVKLAQQKATDITRFNLEYAQRRLNLKADDIDKASRDYIISRGYPSVPHSVGHGVGIEVHELPHIAPTFDDKIQPNTVFTIEPGIYINGYGGVRIEDTVYFDGEKIETLTKSRKELIQL